MDATVAPPPGTRPPVDVASFDRSQLSVYLKDVVTLALENRPEDPIAFASDYLRRVLGGAGAVARAHQYLSLSPHTRRAFTDNALLAFEVLSGDEEGEKPVPGREFNQLIDALLEDAPCAIADRIRDVLRTNDDAEVRWWEFQRATKACFALRELLEELERLYERRGFTGAGPSRVSPRSRRGSATTTTTTMTRRCASSNRDARSRSRAAARTSPRRRSPGCCTRRSGWSGKPYRTRGGRSARRCETWDKMGAPRSGTSPGAS